MQVGTGLVRSSICTGEGSFLSVMQKPEQTMKNKDESDLSSSYFPHFPHKALQIVRLPLHPKLITGNLSSYADTQKQHNLFISSNLKSISLTALSQCL